MKPDEYLEISSKLSEILTTLEDVESVSQLKNQARLSLKSHALMRV
jgi:hypothetical protein